MFKRRKREDSKQNVSKQEIFDKLERIENKLDQKVFFDDVFIENIEEQDVLPLIKRDKHSIRIARQALKNIIEPFPNFETIEYSEDFNWDVTNKKYGQSYQLYIQSLRVVSALTVEYEHTKKRAYLEKAKIIIESWMEYAEDNPQSKMIWYDHPTGNRAQTLIHFLYHARTHFELDGRKYFNILKAHADVMSNPEKYNYNNHGLMMDRALIIIGRVLKIDDYITTGLNRARETFWFSFSAKSIHLENSPSYHGMVVRIYNELEAYLQTIDKSLGETILNYLEQAKRYYSIIATPSGVLPEIGDSSGGAIDKKIYENVFDYELGLTVMQYENPKPVYTTFISGMTHTTHKHTDDLSITLSYGKDDIFVDAGRFNYSKSPIRSYVTSSRAHSTLFIEGMKYERSKDNRFLREIDITSYFDNDAYTLVKGKNEAFEGAGLYRTIIQLKQHPIILILDKAHAVDYEIGQNFNLHHKVEIVNHARDEARLRLASGHEVLLKQFNTPDDYEIVEASTTKPIQAVNTLSFGKTVDTRQLRFKSQASNDYIFETMIVLEPELDVAYRRHGELLFINVNDDEIIINI